MKRLAALADSVFVAFVLGAIALLALYTVDAVAAYRAWPYEQACHHAHVLPTRRPFSATVACLPPTEVPR